MKSKVLLVVAMMGLSASVFAKPTPMICGYTDHLHVSGNSTARPSILGVITATGNARGVQTSDSSFDIVDQQSTKDCNVDSTGTVTVKYATGLNDYCVLHITDGPVHDNPDDKNTQCFGRLSYQGMTYDGFGSYSYSMIFNTKSS